MNHALGVLDDDRGQDAADLDPHEVLRRQDPVAEGWARRLTVATASCTARLIPTPPIGDMAWATSPSIRP
jgi:hypothetical protein